MKHFIILDRAGSSNCDGSSKVCIDTEVWNGYTLHFTIGGEVYRVSKDSNPRWQLVAKKPWYRSEIIDLLKDIEYWEKNKTRFYKIKNPELLSLAKTPIKQLAVECSCNLPGKIYPFCFAPCFKHASMILI
jgi:hypothetical protein